MTTNHRLPVQIRSRVLLDKWSSGYRQSSAKAFTLVQVQLCPQIVFIIKNIVMELKFKSLTDRKDIDLISYVKDYLVKNPIVDIYVGSDSQVHSEFTDYGIVVVLHKGKSGGHVLYCALKREKIKEKFTRLWQEVEYSLQVAEHLKANQIPVKYLDLDLNPDPRWGSNSVLRAAMGYVESMGYVPRCKPSGVAATYAADKICK